MEELRLESIALAQGKEFTNTVIPHQYAFNLFPHNAPFLDNGYNEEEWKMVAETKKIFNQENFKVTATCVRVPVLRAHSEALNIEFLRETSEDEIYSILKEAAGVEVFEDRAENKWAMPIDASGKDPVLVGRVRSDQSQANTFDMWVVGDQVRKGAALNAIQIAEKLL
jgi:aspartate-semialdehyde dehydrogenase